jgi:hypothetical protein
MFPLFARKAIESSSVVRISPSRIVLPQVAASVFRDYASLVDAHPEYTVASLDFDGWQTQYESSFQKIFSSAEFVLQHPRKVHLHDFSSVLPTLQDVNCSPELDYSLFSILLLSSLLFEWPRFEKQQSCSFTLNGSWFEDAISKDAVVLKKFIDAYTTPVCDIPKFNHCLARLSARTEVGLFGLLYPDVIVTDVCIKDTVYRKYFPEYFAWVEPSSVTSYGLVPSEYNDNPHGCLAFLGAVDETSLQSFDFGNIVRDLSNCKNSYIPNQIVLSGDIKFSSFENWVEFKRKYYPNWLKTLNFESVELFSTVSYSYLNCYDYLSTYIESQVTGLNFEMKFIPLQCMNGNSYENFSWNTWLENEMEFFAAPQTNGTVLNFYSYAEGDLRLIGFSGTRGASGSFLLSCMQWITEINIEIATVNSNSNTILCDSFDPGVTVSLNQEDSGPMEIDTPGKTLHFSTLKITVRSEADQTKTKFAKLPARTRIWMLNSSLRNVFGTVC